MPPPWVSLPDIVPEEFCRLLNGQHAGVCQSQTTPAVSLRKAYLAMSAVCRKATLRGYDKHKRSVPDKAGANHHAAGTGSYTLPTATCALIALPRDPAPSLVRHSACLAPPTPPAPGSLAPSALPAWWRLAPPTPPAPGSLAPSVLPASGSLAPPTPPASGVPPPDTDGQDT
jgi:hypothetical protein